MLSRNCLRSISTLPSIKLIQSIKSGLIHPDPIQAEIMKHFDIVFTNFSRYTVSKFRKSAPKSLYLYGGVGRGKTMLMNILFDCCETNLKQKTHFNEFLLNVHKKIHLARNSRNPVKIVASELITNSRLLCFDEFQVTDIADAMILKRLFEELWPKCVVVMTSNSSPDDLYKNGLNREYFLPFIDLLKNNADIVNLDSSVDYRSKDNNALKYYLIIEKETDEKLNKLFTDLAKSETCPVTTKHNSFALREHKLEKTCGGVVDSSFEELCFQELGAADYMKIAERFHTVFIRNMPKMSLKFADQAQRFIKLIDICYLQRVRLVISASTEPALLFASQNPDVDFIGWERTVSRLHEMCTEQYWESNRRQGLLL